MRRFLLASAAKGEGTVKIIAGIDEAGYAPTLGPLVVSASVFRLESSGDADLWKLLSRSVTKNRLRNSEKLLVDDSKKVYSGASRLGTLEKGVLSFMRCCASCSNLTELLQEFSLCGPGELGGMPWYDDFHIGLPVSSDARVIERCRQLLQQDTGRVGIEFLGIRTVPVHVGRLNRDFERIGNKSVALFEYTLELLDYLLRTYGKNELEIIIDKHGGRKRYERLLATGFWGDRVRILSHKRFESNYELSGSLGNARISFVEKADQMCFPVALASMMSKYVRELFMILFNRYWAAHVKGARPTSGYPQDARRFLKLIEPVVVERHINPNVLIRSR